MLGVASPDDRLLAWLDTLGKDVRETIAEEPDETIVPPAPSTRGARAMSLMQKLETGTTGASLKLEEGEIIGEGGMGVVRTAQQTALGRTVAVKTLKRPDPTAALDLLREAWVTSTIEHPNVVPIHYVEVDDDGVPLIVLKRVEGIAWSRLVNDPVEVERRFGTQDQLAWNLGILMQVLNAIRYAHHRGVLHRDLKPSNVMVGDFGEVYLIDWGVAVSLRDDGSGRLPLAANSTGIAGTPAYMAPEMLGRDGDPPLSERTDVYLAGAVLYELVVGHPPHVGSSLMSMISSIIESKPELPESVPAELAEICARAIHVDPARRFESAEEMRLALQAYLEHRGSAELAARARTRLAELNAMLAPGSTPATRDDIYRAFGACRFGFIEALARWPGNAAARADLDRATIAVAEYELADHPAAALTLLAEIDAPELTARARAAVEARNQNLAALENMRDQLDVRIGSRTRHAISLVFGTLFTVLPFGRRAAASDDPIEVAVAGLAILGLLAVAGWWTRRTLLSTLFNRRVYATVAFVFLIQAMLGFSAPTLELTPVQLHLGLLASWGTIAGVCAITTTTQLVPSALGYLGAFVFAARFPEYRIHAISASNFVMTVNALAMGRSLRTAGTTGSAPRSNQ